ncbi:tetratricopeptide repeat protein [uncultured Sulfitobacter sp.]|uniref:tetratricopeptide repeat protein n=1 Tax=uncultured Sulfitobacter sp. TaxID=191468 RepID=UPI002635A7BD|nr:tetratricopeptide repeat protein [uncultured Sulfitobacter sp.]
MRILLATALTLALPLAAFAASDETAPPKKPKCNSGFVYDKKTKSCVSSNGHTLDVDTLYQEVRALSYDGRYNDAQVLLAQMPAEDDRTLTYMGFTNRKMGNAEAAMTYYARALARNPGNVMARSYMGQGLVEDGQIAAALEQLREIRAHGGEGTWAEASLRTAIATGRTFNW